MLRSFLKGVDQLGSKLLTELCCVRRACHVLCCAECRDVLCWVLARVRSARHSRGQEGEGWCEAQQL